MASGAILETISQYLAQFPGTDTASPEQIVSLFEKGIKRRQRRDNLAKILRCDNRTATLHESNIGAIQLESSHQRGTDPQKYLQDGSHRESIDR